jgi:hypothetical protein
MLSSSWALQPRVGLGLLKTTPPLGTVKGDISPVSNTDVGDLFQAHQSIATWVFHVF